MKILLLCLTIIISGCSVKDISKSETFTKYFWPDVSNPKITLVDVLNKERIEERMSFFKKFFGLEPELIPIYRPFALAADDEYIAISDIQFGVIFLIDKKKYSLTIIDRLKKRSFKSIVGLDIKDKKLYIVDSENNLIGYFDLLTKKEHIFNIQTQKPVSIKVDLINKLMFIIDISRDIVLVTDMDGNIFNSIKGDLNYPIDLDIIPEDRKIFVLDAMNHRVKVYTYLGDLLKTFGGIGNRPGYFSKPKGLCIDQYKRVYVTDADFDNIQIFNDNGELLYFIGSTGIDLANFYLIGKAYCYKNELYFSDIFNSRVQVFYSFE